MPPGQVSVNVRTHFIDDDDAKEAIADRAKALRSRVIHAQHARSPSRSATSSPT
jgi:hypothetical protein